MAEGSQREVCMINEERIFVALGIPRSGASEPSQKVETLESKVTEAIPPVERASFSWENIPGWFQWRSAQEEPHLHDRRRLPHRIDIFSRSLNRLGASGRPACL